MTKVRGHFSGCLELISLELDELNRRLTVRPIWSAIKSDLPAMECPLSLLCVASHEIMHESYEQHATDKAKFSTHALVVTAMILKSCYRLLKSISCRSRLPSNLEQNLAQTSMKNLKK